MLKLAPAADSAPDRIVLVSFAPAPMTTLVSRRLAHLFPQGKIDHAPSLALAASEKPDARIVLALLDPAEAIASLLADHATKREAAPMSAVAALKRWIDETAPILEATRHLRRRLWLVDARSMADGRPQVLAPESEAMSETPELTPAAPAQYLALAEQLIRSDPQAARLAAEIAALRRGPGGLPLDLDMAFAGLVSPAKETTELALLRETLALVQTELDANAEALAAAQQDLAAQDAIKAEAARLQAELAEQVRLKQEVGLLRETLSLLQSELESSARALVAARQDRLDHEVLKARFAAAERQLAESAEHGRLRQEVLAAEILKMSGIVVAERARFGAELQTMQAEAGLLQGQLQASQAEIGNLHGQVQTAQTEIDNLRSQVQAAQSETGALQGQLQAALHEINLLHASTSWQVTAPLRAVKRRLAGQ